ncbi:hypothetical protein GCM10010449_67160 [Streptomyces rectiviolaceus]|uniref:Uncharacterized protein n=1 Tax=Streptomyces rectiviolaceus TaxID=332591 RepID=A0ABP6N5Q5_9ACTN
MVRAAGRRRFGSCFDLAGAGAGTGAWGGAGGLGADAVHPPAAAGRDASEFLDVDVDQVADPAV